MSSVTRALRCKQFGFDFFGKRKSAQKMLVKCRWNWLKVIGEKCFEPKTNPTYHQGHNVWHTPWISYQLSMEIVFTSRNARVVFVTRPRRLAMLFLCRHSNKLERFCSKYFFFTFRSWNTSEDFLITERRNLTLDFRMQDEENTNEFF